MLWFVFEMFSDLTLKRMSWFHLSVPYRMGPHSNHRFLTSKGRLQSSHHKRLQEDHQTDQVREFPLFQQISAVKVLNLVMKSRYSGVKVWNEALRSVLHFILNHICIVFTCRVSRYFAHGRESRQRLELLFMISSSFFFSSK